MKHQAIFLLALVSSKWRSTEAKGCSCSTKQSCDSIYNSFGEQLYKVSAVSGPWSDLISLDNTGSSGPATYSVTYDIGFSETTSTSVQKSWNVQSGISFSGFAASAGYSNTVTSMNTETWSSSVSRTLRVTVPGGTMERFWQRNIEFDLVSGPKLCNLVDASSQLYMCVDVFQNYLVYTSQKNGCEATCLVCGYDSPPTSQKLSFSTECYSSAVDEGTRDKFCPIPGIDTPPQEMVHKLRGTKEKRVDFKVIANDTQYTVQEGHSQGQTILVFEESD